MKATVFIILLIVHSTKLLNFDWSRAVQLTPNSTLYQYLLIGSLRNGFGYGNGNDNAIEQWG